jgi:undecaprenyl-diphosphatase
VNKSFPRGPSKNFNATGKDNMDIYGQTIILGLIQGVTEFLPISSSGHLALAQNLMGFQEPAIFLDLMLHAGTLLAALVFLRNEIIMILRGIFTKGAAGAQGRKLLALAAIASVPTACIGFFFRDVFSAMFSSLLAVALGLITTGILLFLTRILQPARDIKLTAMGWGAAFIIGIAQGLAITPGLSRSGATISTGLFLGLNKELAFRFSFLISIPAILGALLLESVGLAPGGVAAAPAALLGALTAAGSGLLALKVLDSLVKKGQLFWFFPYCLLLGFCALYFS